jgi:DNA-directed RNA polymerase subunit RPC12/RpoP
MPARRKFDLEKIRASLATDCPHCGHGITPAERTHVDTEHLECPHCHERYIPGKEKPISTS